MKLDNVIGHEKQKRILNNQLKQNQLSHTYLFSGPDGIGKRTLAEAFAIQIIKSGLINKERKVSLNHADIIKAGYENDQISISEVRDIIDQTIVLPLEGEYRVFIIDNADKINTIAQNALLKTIEEPNPGNIFIFITSTPNKLIQTVRSRCQELLFHDLNEQEKISLLKIKGIDYIPKDLTLTPGNILKEIEDPEYYEKLNNFYNQFIKIINGNSFELFSLSEELSKDKVISKNALEFFIKKLNELSFQDNKINFKIIKIINILFDLLEKLTYNVNLRLQWECSLIQIITEQI